MNRSSTHLKHIVISFVCMLFLFGIYSHTVYAQPSTIAFYPISEDTAATSSASPALLNPALVDAFYKLNKLQPFWYTNNQSVGFRKAFVNIVDSAANLGLDAKRYHYKELQLSLNVNSLVKDSTLPDYDKIYTDAALSLMKDIYVGNNLNSQLRYDEISAKYKEKDNQFLLNKLINVHSSSALSLTFAALEPVDNNYRILKKELQVQLKRNAVDTIRQLSSALNLLRWINHFHFQKYLIVNIASASLKYYQNEKVALNMKVVVGKPSTQTPRFAAYCNQVILYPYWNVPASIALNELLPKFKRNPGLVESMNMQVLSSSGKILDPYSINWSAYSRADFPYHFRQSTGCDNSLGVIKFNLTDPFTVYMHDTNYKDAFLFASRYLSHGCIRLEKPIELANLILPDKIDSAYLQSCLRDQQPLTFDIQEPVPVFVIYNTAQVNEGSKVKYMKDIYRLFKK